MHGEAALDAAGADDVLAKPVLRAVLYEHLSQSQPQPAAGTLQTMTVATFRAFGCCSSTTRSGALALAERALVGGDMRVPTRALRRRGAVLAARIVSGRRGGRATYACPVTDGIEFLSRVRDEFAARRWSADHP